MIRFFVVFLFLVFSSFSFASKTYYYYSTPSNFCSSVPDTVCQSYNRSDSVSSLTYAGQYNINNNEGYLTCGFNSVQFDYFGPGKHHSQYFQPPFPNVAHAVKNQIVCADDETMELNGCTATCITDPCKQFKDQDATGLVTCGTASCPSPTVFECSGGYCGCTGGAKTQIIPSPSASAVINGCAATLKAGQALPTTAKIKTSAAGSSSTMAYCQATYVYTGVSANPNVTPSDLVSLSFGGVTATTENGQCPDGTVKGQLNNSWVCVADSNKGTNAGCPTGQIKNNQGQCVPFSEAGTGSGSGSGDGSGGGGGTCTITGQTQVNGVCSCPTGQVVQNNQCVSSDTGSGSGSGTGNGSGSGDGSGGGGGSCTITGQTQVNGSCQCPTGQTVQNNQCTASSSSGDGEEGSEGSYSGSNKCQQAPACSGDAILCGLMAEQYKSKCETLEQIGSVPDDVKQAANELGEEVTNNQDINGMKQAVTGYMNTLQSLVVPSNSACVISNIQLQILAKTIEIPLSQFCPFFELIRLMLNITIDLIVLRIVSRAVLSAG